LTTRNAIPGAQCTVCGKSMDQTKLTHYPDHIPPNNRWTCSSVCQNRLKKRAQNRAQEDTALKSMDMGNPMEALGLEGPSEAQKAREALNQVEEAASSEDLVVFKSQSSPEHVIALVVAMLQQAPLLHEEDMQHVIELSMTYLASLLKE